MRRLIVSAVGLCVFCLMWTAPDADAQPAPVQPLPTPPGGGSGEFGGGIAGEPGIGGGPNLSPVAASALFLCPGVGIAVNVLGGGGGYCDFDFVPVELANRSFGVMHIHCEFGGFAPVAASWQCWRVFPGQPDHPRLPDPDIIPDGMGVPWAIGGPNPQDQWPPPGLAPAPEPPPGPPPPEPPP
jgi:hypothetical protein